MHHAQPCTRITNAELGQENRKLSPYSKPHLANCLPDAIYLYLIVDTFNCLTTSFPSVLCRTLQGFRACTRVYIMLLGVLYGPFYAHLCEAYHVSIGIAYAASIQLVLCGLYTIMMAMEDPFAHDEDAQTGRAQLGLDLVRVHEALRVARWQLDIIERDAALDWRATAEPARQQLDIMERDAALSWRATGSTAEPQPPAHNT